MKNKVHPFHKIFENEVIPEHILKKKGNETPIVPEQTRVRADAVLNHLLLAIDHGHYYGCAALMAMKE
ncbi:hypothetical protein [Zooshikella sp. RANM57]|uniref:hypothetical protein n=1 Tax=Zooshikella sp. RANM57 TaxID=3425863 RepID=UPI003D6DE04A